MSEQVHPTHSGLSNTGATPSVDGAPDALSLEQIDAYIAQSEEAIDYYQKCITKASSQIEEMARLLEKHQTLLKELYNQRITLTTQHP